MFSERQDVLIQHSCDLSVSLGQEVINGIKVRFVSGTFSVRQRPILYYQPHNIRALSLNDPLAAPLTRITFIVCSQDEKNSGMNTAKSSLGSKFSKKDISPTWSLSYYHPGQPATLSLATLLPSLLRVIKDPKFHIKSVTASRNRDFPSLSYRSLRRRHVVFIK